MTAMTKYRHYGRAHEPEPEHTALLPRDRQLLEAAQRALRESARVMGRWRDYQEYATTMLGIEALITARLEGSDAASAKEAE